MQDHTENNNHFAKLMQKSMLDMPFTDFDEMVMQRITLEITKQKTLAKDRKLSFLFFILGSCFGLIINTILQRSNFIFLNIPAKTLSLFFQTVFVAFFLFQLEKNLPLIKDWKKSRQKA